MKFAKVAWAIALMVVPSASLGQGTAVSRSGSAAQVAEPGPDAMALARMLAFQRFGLVRRTTAAEMKELIEHQLLSTHLATRGSGCDPHNSECRAIAERISSEHATAFAQALNDAVDRGFAEILEAKMSRAEIRSASAFFRTDAGRAFANASFRLDPGDEAMASLAQAFKFPGAPFDEFYDATKHLPRAAMNIAPPAPAPPPPARMKR